MIYNNKMLNYTAPYAPVPTELILIFVVALLWTIILKGYALWHAARGGQRNWFVVLLIVNTLGILEIIYLIWFRKELDVPTEQPVTLKSPAE